MLGFNPPNPYDMSKTRFVNGVNPEALKRWKEEDRQERIVAFHELLHALWRLEELYEVPSESDHPLEKAYDLIYQFGDDKGLLEDPD